MPKYVDGAVVRFRRDNETFEGVVDKFIGESEGVPYYIVGSVTGTVYGIPEHDILSEVRPAVAGKPAQPHVPAVTHVTDAAKQVEQGEPKQRNFKSFMERINGIDKRLEVVGIADGQIEIKLPYIKDRAEFTELIGKIKAAGGRFDWVKKTWSFEVK